MLSSARSFFVRWIRRGAGVNDAPVAHQSRGTACPQAGESTFPHQENRCTVRCGGFFFLSGGQKNRAGTQRADSISSLSLFFLSLFFLFCASSPRGAARFFFPTGRKTHRCGWLDRLGRGSIEIAVRAQKAYRFSEQAYNITRFLLCQEYFNKNLVKMN